MWKSLFGSNTQHGGTLTISPQDKAMADMEKRNDKIYEAFLATHEERLGKLKEQNKILEQMLEATQQGKQLSPSNLPFKVGTSPQQQKYYTQQQPGSAQQYGNGVGMSPPPPYSAFPPQQQQGEFLSASEYFGRGMDKHSKRDIGAFSDLWKALSLGEVKAAIPLADCYMHGTVVKQNIALSGILLKIYDRCKVAPWNISNIMQEQQQVEQTWEPAMRAAVEVYARKGCSYMASMKQQLNPNQKVNAAVAMQNLEKLWNNVEFNPELAKCIKFFSRTGNYSIEQLIESGFRSDKTLKNQNQQLRPEYCSAREEGADDFASTEFELLVKLGVPVSVLGVSDHHDEVDAGI